MIKRRSAALGIVLALGTALAAAPARGEEQGLTPAQTALFESDHLRAIERPVRLDYRFEHQGQDPYQDKVTAEIREVRPDGRKNVWVDFLSGSREMHFPPAIGYRGNPVLMYFLEHDVLEMHQATGGAALYFRNRIRQAFLDAEMHPVTITLDGEQRRGTEIVIAPFEHDPNIARFPAFAKKTYRFVLSDAVPGTIYRISTAVPAAEPGARGLFEESMTYLGEHDGNP
jgi:hypothetical protein